MNDPAAVKAPNALRRIAEAFAQPSALVMFVFGFGSGLPFLLVGYSLSIWLREVGLDLGSIGLVSYISLLYTLKFLWAPALDRWAPPLPLGQRRGWLVVSQVGVAAGLFAMGAYGPQVAALAPFLCLMALVAFAGATQDAVVDAYRIEITTPEAQGALAATYMFGYRMGLIVGGAGVLYVADGLGWSNAYYAMGALMLVPVATTLFAREPTRERPRDAATPEHTPAMEAFIAPLTSRLPASRGVLLSRFVAPLVEFLQRNGPLLAIALLVFVGLFKLPDQMLGVITGPFYRDSGFSKSEIATVAKLYGVWIGLAGTFAGGVAIAAFGVRRTILPAALAVALSNLLFILMAVYPGQEWSFIAAISGDNFAQGFAGTVLVAFMSVLVSRHYTATQYALLSSLANMPGKLIGGMSGFMVQAWSYTGFFAFSAISIVPTLLLLWWLSRRPEWRDEPG
ncbi:AmpG family muropeptide MFS transporter [Tahibacter soli]